MNGDATKFHASFEVFRGTVSIRMAVQQPSGALAVAQPAVFEVLEPGSSYSPPFLELEPKAAQTLMDELWSCGFRPTEGSGSAGMMAATERHLADMRTIAMAALRAQKVQV